MDQPPAAERAPPAERAVFNEATCVRKPPFESMSPGAIRVMPWAALQLFGWTPMYSPSWAGGEAVCLCVFACVCVWEGVR